MPLTKPVFLRYCREMKSKLSLDAYLECFPEVTREQAVAVLACAHKSVFETSA
jgi:uncharacterized protein (DUF433 family)